MICDFNPLRSQREEYKDAKFFLTVASAWDMMLSTEVVSRRQRRADYDNFKICVDENCAEVFPNSLMQLLGQWVEGKDLVQVLT